MPFGKCIPCKQDPQRVTTEARTPMPFGKQQKSGSCPEESQRRPGPPCRLALLGGTEANGVVTTEARTPMPFGFTTRRTIPKQVTTEARTPMPFGESSVLYDSLSVTTEARTPMPFGSCCTHW